MSRYNRHIILSDVVQHGQDKLSMAKVLVIGAGGLGCPILQYLAAAGIGALGIIDFDDVDLSNLQRQILFGTESLGTNKAKAAKKRLEDLNPTIHIEAIDERLTSRNAIDLFYRYDIIVDGTDNFVTRYLVNDAAILTNKPFVYGAIYKFEGQVSVFNFKNGPSYRCLFPNTPNEGSVANCSEVGVLGVLPGIIGTMMANEVIKIILEFDHVLSGKLLCYNSRTTEMTSLKINKNQNEIDKIKNNPELVEVNQEDVCTLSVSEISNFDADVFDNIQFIDVRELSEQPKLDLENCIEIPLSNLENNISLIDRSKTTIVFCQSGVRSKKAVELLKNHGIKESLSFKGGVFEIINVLKIKVS
jgi:adenylyltransferase/sulfurtransferase